MKTHLPPLAFFLVGLLKGVVGVERMEIRPEQELVVKYEGCELRVLSKGIIGASMLPFGDLSVSGEFIEATVAAFLFSNSIDFDCVLAQ